MRSQYNSRGSRLPTTNSFLPQIREFSSYLIVSLPVALMMIFWPVTSISIALFALTYFLSGELLSYLLNAACVNAAMIFEEDSLTMTIKFGTFVIYSVIFLLLEFSDRYNNLVFLADIFFKRFISFIINNLSISLRKDDSPKWDSLVIPPSKIELWIIGVLYLKSIGCFILSTALKIVEAGRLSFELPV